MIGNGQEDPLERAASLEKILEAQGEGRGTPASSPLLPSYRPTLGRSSWPGSLGNVFWYRLQGNWHVEGGSESTERDGWHGSTTLGEKAE